VQDLQEILGAATSDAASLRSELVHRLGDLLAVLTVAVPLDVPGVTTTLAPRAEVSPDQAASQLLELLEALRKADFVDVDGRLGSVEPADLAGMRLVVTGGPGAKLDDDAVLLPLLDRLGQTDDPLVVVVEAGDDDPATPAAALVGAVRGDRRLRNRLSTVDDGEGFAGWAATVLALDDLARGRVGHYGTAEGAERLLPAPASP
jgi:Copper transport outer membrane protein, MctB